MFLNYTSQRCVYEQSNHKELLRKHYSCQQLTLSDTAGLA